LCHSDQFLAIYRVLGLCLLSGFRGTRREDSKVPNGRVTIGTKTVALTIAMGMTDRWVSCILWSTIMSLILISSRSDQHGHQHGRWGLDSRHDRPFDRTRSASPTLPVPPPPPPQAPLAVIAMLERRRLGNEGMRRATWRPDREVNMRHLQFANMPLLIDFVHS
jgi:hypothetical protein